MRRLTKETYKIYWDHVRPYRGLAVLMLASLIIGTVVDVIVPIFYKRFFDVLAAGIALPTAKPALFNIIFIILGMHALGWVVWRVSIFANNYLQPRVMTDLANTSFEYLHQHSYGFFVNRFAGALVRKVNRFSGAFEGVADKLYWDLLPLVLKTIGILGVLFYKNVLLGTAMLGWSVVFMAVNYALTMYKLKYDVEAAEINTKVTARLADTITNQVNIKIFAKFRDELSAFRRLTDEEFRINYFTWNLGGYIESLQAALTIALEFGIFYLAIGLWSKGILTVGDFVLLQAYVLQMVWRLWDFGRIFRQLYRNLADAEEMTEILMTPHEIKDKPNAKELVVSRGAVEFDRVRFGYQDGREVVNVSLAIAPGEKVGFVGPSGAGKTTLSALLLRFYDIDSGAIRIDGENIGEVTQESLRKNIALVPQEPILFHRTLAENIRYGKPEASDEEVIRAAHLAHCDEFIERLPDRYETYVGERGIKLSGGERQRIAIARAILKSAPILVLDEATSSLDSHSELLIQDALGKLMEGKTTIVIAHRLSTIMRMDRIIVLKDGSVEETGTHQSLLANSVSLYKKLWDLQAGGFIA